PHGNVAPRPSTDDAATLRPVPAPAAPAPHAARLRIPQIVGTLPAAPRAPRAPPPAPRVSECDWTATVPARADATQRRSIAPSFRRCPARAACPTSSWPTARSRECAAATAVQPERALAAPRRRELRARW